jgi:trans-aconitate methyltransferase
MRQDPADPTGPNSPAVDLNTSVAHPARVYDYWLGGQTNFPADREAGDRVLAATPGLRERVRAGRAFLVRVVRFLVESAGVAQFLDIGCGIPSANNTHEVAQALNPRARVVYVDNDPIVYTHATALLAGTSEGASDFVLADLRDLDAVLAAARRTLDFTEPIAVLLLGVLHLIQDHEDPWGIVARLTAAVPAGSYLAISHPALDIGPQQRVAQQRYNERVSTPQTLRERPDVARFFTGLDLVPPGLVQVHQWRPDPDEAVPSDFASAHGGVARKP